MPLPWNPSLKHGHAAGHHQSRTYQAWVNMRARCNNPKAAKYKYYGGRGISVDERWFYFQAFLADMGECPPGLMIERMDNNGNYAPGNCRWATREDQCANTRKQRLLTYDGKTMSIAAWARHLGVPVNVLYQRIINLKWPINEALSTPKTNGADGSRTRLIFARLKSLSKKKK